MNKYFTKNSILKLLSGMSSEKEIRKYLERFSSDEYRFAVIKVGGAVIQSDLENLVSSLAFLNEVGLRPIIVHGAGPMLSKELEEQGIEFSFVDGQRVTTEEVLDVAVSIFTRENLKLTDALKEEGVKAVSLVGEIFECSVVNESLGYVGEVVETFSDKIKDIILNNGVPVIAPVGKTSDGQVVNINADKATLALASEISPDKVIFLSDVGGILDENNNLICRN
jgi:acetylglutamate kinase